MSIIACRPNFASALFFPIDRAVEAVRVRLAGLGYNPTSTDSICDYLRDIHRVSGLVSLGVLDAEDEGLIRVTFAEAYHAEPSRPGPTDREWDEWAWYAAMQDASDPTPDCLEQECAEVGARIR